MSNPWATTGSAPRGIAIFGGYIYSANSGNNTISKISLADPSGDNNPTWVTATFGLSSPRGLAIYDGYIYCANANNSTISKISLADPSGDNTLNWTATGSGPRGLIIDVTDPLDPYIYTANLGSNTISKINLTDPSGPLTNLNWAATGSGTQPIGLAILDGYIYVSLSTNVISKISLTDPTGDVTPSWATSGNGASGLEINGGYIYCANFFGNTISKISLTNPSGDNNPNWNLAGSAPQSLAIDNGFIYVSNTGESTIWKISLTDNMPNPWARTGLVPLYLATDGTYIYCANFTSNSISRISLTNPRGDNNSSWATGITRPSGLAVDVANGFLYCSYISGGNSGQIAKLTLGNTPVIDLNWKIVGTMFGINSLAIDSLSNFIYCATGNNRISKISLTGGTDQLSWAATGTGPQGLAIDSDNQYIYVSLQVSGTISKISLADPTVIISSWATTGTTPRGLAIDDGYIYCANSGINTISKISLTNPGGENNPNWAVTGITPVGLVIDTGFIYESNSDSTIWKISLTTPCFNKGTKILCLNSVLEEEYIPIEDLKKGDLVKSYLHGYRRIDSIGTNKMINNPEHFNLSMYKMAKTLENGLTEDLIVTGGHSILVDDLGDYYSENEGKFKGKIPTIDGKYFLLSAVSKDFIQLTDTNEYTYYHLVLENNGDNDERFGIWANGILTETISKNQFTEIEQILH